MQRHLIQTKDNSPTLFVPELDEHYHSVHGALQESLHVFIEAGLRHQINSVATLNILEVGFGTGLNAWLTLVESLKYDTPIRYYGIEKYPVSLKEAKALNYDHSLPGSSASEFLRLHLVGWESWHPITPQFSFFKNQSDLHLADLNGGFDLIYFDAFAPSAQADLWSLSVFTKLFHSLNKGGCLVTYCVKGSVRRTMKEAGFRVEKIPGPPGKREMARAFKDA